MKHYHFIPKDQRPKITVDFVADVLIFAFLLILGAVCLFSQPASNLN
jgi:hypothetical protein